MTTTPAPAADRPELAASIAGIPMPDNLKGRPISAKGFPVPFFVAWLDPSGRLVKPGTGTPDFRVVDTGAFAHCVKFDACWLCGRPMGRYRTIAIGPMCLVNRVTSEPSCHPTCAEYAVLACPFLVQPKARRNDKGLPDDRQSHPHSIGRNPGVIALYVHTARSLTLLRQASGAKALFWLPGGEPHRLTFWREGRRATREEVLESIRTGLPLLEGVAREQGGDAVKALADCRNEAVRLVLRWTDDFESRDVNGDDRQAGAAGGVPG